MISVVIPIMGESHSDNLKYMIGNLKRSTMKYELVLVEQHGTIFIDWPCDKYASVIPKNNLFNRNWLMNVGAKMSCGEKILFIDADITFRCDYLDKLYNFTKSWFVGWKRMYYFDAETTKKIKDGFYPDNVMDYAKDMMTCDPTCSCGASTCIDRKFFFESFGGFNENYFGWGAEDNDSAVRARAIIGKFECVDYSIGHLNHDDDRILHREKSTSENNLSQLRITQKHATEITRRILTSNIGSIHGPTTIKTSDLEMTCPR